jgi:hypothetical protein
VSPTFVGDAVGAPATVGAGDGLNLSTSTSPMLVKSTVLMLVLFDRALVMELGSWNMPLAVVSRNSR